MNCFNNNRPKLSASDRIKNKKAQAMFKANVMDYQKRSTGGKGKCVNYKGNVGFYNNGKLRKVENYETLMNINKGSALCVDGAYKQCLNLEDDNGIEIKKGLNACGRNNNAKITLGSDNIYTIFSGFKNLTNLFSGFTTLKTYYFGNNPFESAVNSIVDDFKLDEENPKDSVVVIDPSNNLFGSNFCSTDMDNKSEGPNKYLQYSSVNKFIIAEGHIFNPTTNAGPSLCGSSQNVPDIDDFVGFGSNFTNTTANIVDPNTKGIGYVFKKCCGIGPNGETNWWKIYIRPLVLIGENPSITSLGFFKKTSTITNIPIETVMGLLGGVKKPLITIYGTGDPCNRNLQSGNKTQQNYLVTYGITSAKTRFNINPNIYNGTNARSFTNIVSSVSSFTPAPVSTLSSTNDIFMFNDTYPSLYATTTGTDAYKSVRNSADYDSNNIYSIDYNNGFDRVNDANGRIIISGNKYKSVLFKLTKNNNVVTFRGRSYAISNNKLAIKRILTHSNLLKSDVINKIFDDSNEDYLGLVYNEGTTVKHLLGNLKINGSISSNISSNWLTTSKETTITYNDTKSSNYGTMDGDFLIVNNTLSDNIWIILQFKNNN